MCMYIYIYIYIYIHTYIHTYIYIYIYVAHLGGLALTLEVRRDGLLQVLDLRAVRGDLSLGHVMCVYIYIYIYLYVYIYIYNRERET